MAYKGITPLPCLDRRVRLRDGRTLGYAEYGAPDGLPLVHFHGFPSSRLEFAPNHEAATQAGLRVISPDRPGVGLSTLRPGRTLLRWADDVAELADALGLDRFALLGWSGGGPYVAACAYRMPARLTAVGVVAGSAPPPAPGGPARLLRAAGRAPALAGKAAITWQFGRMIRRDPQRFLRLLVRTLPPADRDVLLRPEVWHNEAVSVGEAFRGGNRTPLREVVLTSRPWGFDLGAVTTPVLLWLGDADRNVPASHADRWSARLPHCEVTRYAGEGHLVFYSRGDEILGRLASEITDRGAL